MFFFLLLVVEFTDFEGYVNFTSSLKKSKGNVDFVEVNINCEINTNHGISYDINRFPLYLKKTLKGCYMLNAEVSMENVIITDNTVIKPKDVIFENVKHEPSAVTMAAILNKCLVYSRVTVFIKLFSISQTVLSTKKSQPCKECEIVDETNVVRTITFLIQHI